VYGQGGAGAARPNPGLPGQGATAPGAAGPGQPTAPIWQAAPGQGGAGQGAWAPGGIPASSSTPPAGMPSAGRSMDMPHAADARGFLSALFDFSFTSFVTTKIIKVLYVLILVLAVISALIYTIVAFRVSATFGFLTLIIGDPLFILIVMAFWRLVLESFAVRFRIAEDVRAMRERADH
jgi:Domain of unknown function (DUF4282)